MLRKIFNLDDQTEVVVDAKKLDELLKKVKHQEHLIEVLSLEKQEHNEAYLSCLNEIEKLKEINSQLVKKITSQAKDLLSTQARFMWADIPRFDLAV